MQINKSTRTREAVVDNPVSDYILEQCKNREKQTSIRFVFDYSQIMQHPSVNLFYVSDYIKMYRILTGTKDEH